jgi:hypothetical protein
MPLPSALRRRRIALLLLIALAACAERPYVPDFAARRFEPFNRADAIAIALREWRLFGETLDSDQAEARPERAPADKPERRPGLWERVGEYWWIGLAPGSPESAWTGKHDARGTVFPAADDESYAWSAAFISYVMRIAGAGDRFPYAANHATYVNAAAAGRSPILHAYPAAGYAPQRGDLICYGRHWAARLRFSDLPTGFVWPGHCAIVVAVEPSTLLVIGGNVDDAVTMTRVPIGADGRLTDPAGQVLDSRYPWFVVLQVLYDAEAEPAADD